jgi:DNA-binding transcriptional regulator YdaS (Cro superfamily)
LKLDKWLIENSVLIGDFATSLEVHRSTVQNWLSGRTVPSPSVLLRIEATTGGKVTAIDFITQQRRAAKRRLDPS